jgi:hypothetical protein
MCFGHSERSGLRIKDAGSGRGFVGACCIRRSSMRASIESLGSVRELMQRVRFAAGSDRGERFIQRPFAG